MHAMRAAGGGLNDDECYKCECPWIIQLSDDEAGPKVKIDPSSQEFGAGKELRELLPFDISDAEFQAGQNDDDETDDTAADDEEACSMHKLLGEAMPPSRPRQ